MPMRRAREHNNREVLARRISPMINRKINIWNRAMMRRKQTLTERLRASFSPTGRYSIDEPVSYAWVTSARGSTVNS